MNRSTPAAGLLAFIKDPAVVAKLFDTIAPRFSQRPGGYTRIIRLGNRVGDGAQRAIIELIGSEYKPDKKESKGAKKAFSISVGC